MALAGCRRCMTCNALTCTQNRVFWPGFTDTCTYFMLARKNMIMMMMSSKDANWVDKKQETSPLAERRNVKLSLKIPAVLGTGLINDHILYVRTIDTSITSITKIIGSKSRETSTSPTSTMDQSNIDIQTPETPETPESLWEDNFMYMMFF